MSGVPLRLGPLSMEGFTLYRSGVQWLGKPGEHRRANEVFAFCNLQLDAQAGRRTGAPAFGADVILQVAFASRVAGRIEAGVDAKRGGQLDVLGIEAWNEATPIAELIADDDGAREPVDAGRLRLLLLEGRRTTSLFDVGAGLLPGWLNRRRGWWCEAGEMPLALLSLGICDVGNVVIGERSAFLELFEALPWAAHVSYAPDHPLAPALPVVLDGLARTPAEHAAIAADIRACLVQSTVASTANDWIFAGALLGALLSSPITDRVPIFSASGRATAGPPQVVLLSLRAEPQSILRHKALGYHVYVLPHHRSAAGPAMRAWLAGAFEPVRRSMDDIRRDYERLIDELHRTTGARLVVFNRMSSSAREDVASYTPFDLPLGDVLENIAAKEMNLMLHDIAAERPLSIVDVDALAAEFGAARHLPDAMHQSADFAAALRAQLASALGDREVDVQVGAGLARG